MKTKFWSGTERTVERKQFRSWRRGSGMKLYQHRRICAPCLGELAGVWSMYRALGSRQTSIKFLTHHVLIGCLEVEGNAAKAWRQFRVSVMRLGWGQILTGDCNPLVMWAWRSQLTFILLKCRAVCPSQVSNRTRDMTASVTVKGWHEKKWRKNSWHLLC